MELASLEIRLSRSENLPVLPQAVSTIIRLADDPNTSQRDLEKAFERDPAITAKIMRVANSAYYGGTPVPNIGRAISFLGITQIRSLVVGVAFQQMTAGKSLSRCFNKLEYWKHSLATGIAARILGKLKCPAKAEELYCTGMMHDIGLMVMEKFMPAELDEALGMAMAYGIPLWRVEEEKHGFDHAEVGGIMAKRWGMPSIIEHGIRFHHKLDEDTLHRDTTVLIAAANAIAHEAGYRRGMPEGANALTPDLMIELDLPEAQLSIVREVIVKEVEKAQEAFHIAA